jgi:hypothetical protein
MLYQILTPPVQSSAGLLWDVIELDEASAAELIKIGVVDLIQPASDEPTVVETPAEPVSVEVAGLVEEVEPEAKPVHYRRAK